MDALYVSGMKNNLISVLAMEEKAFDVTFSEGQVLMHPRGCFHHFDQSDCSPLWETIQVQFSVGRSIGV